MKIVEAKELRHSNESLVDQQIWKDFMRTQMEWFTEILKDSTPRHLHLLQDTKMHARCLICYLYNL